jgi:hypothetical protein
MSLLQMVKDACDELSLPRPNVVANSTDPQVRQLFRLANVEGRNLAKRHNWQVLTSEHTFTTTATAVQLTASALPTDFNWIIPETMWNRSSRRRVYGPIDNQEWQGIKGSSVNSVDPAFRIKGNTILLTPNPTTGHSIYYEYVSKNWCQSSGGTAQAAWAADTDTGRLDEFLMTLGIVWRFRKAKKLNFADEFAVYEREVTDAIIRDGSRPRLSTNSMSDERSPRPPTTPDTLVFS